MIFWRIFNDTVYPVKEVKKLGFEESEGLRIPDEYLQSRNFTVLRTIKGIGDWGIISAMPRLLKVKYPDCKVFVPSNKLFKQLFNVDTNVMYDIFSNNPYVDGFSDTIQGEIFHDHYRIYSNDNSDIPLLEQMLKFWQFEESEYCDSQPELYWSDEEKNLGDAIIKEYVGEKDFGALLVSERFGTQFGKYDKASYINDYKKINNLLEEFQLPYFYWTHKPLNLFNFKNINPILDMHNMDLRLQLYIKSKAKVNISNQCGTNHCVVRYSDVYEVKRQSILGLNFVKGENYV